MPNQASKKGHQAIRTCVVCRAKREQKDMLRFAIIEDKIVFDRLRKIWSHGQYCCANQECVSRLRGKKKKFGKFKIWIT
jgi:predicted RNA-binding protein YlxR (DUF448 family)